MGMLTEKKYSISLQTFIIIIIIMIIEYITVSYVERFDLPRFMKTSHYSMDHREHLNSVSRSHRETSNYSMDHHENLNSVSSSHRGTSNYSMDHHKNVSSVRSSHRETSNYSMDYCENLNFGSGSYKAYWIRAEGSLKERVSAYNKVISALRKKLINGRKMAEWKVPSEKPDLFWCTQDDFLKNLIKYPQVNTVALTWLMPSNPRNWDSRTDSQNILIKDYYHWTGCDFLCNKIKYPDLNYKKFVVYDRTCSSLNSTEVSDKQSLETVYFHIKLLSKTHYWPNGGNRFPDYFYKLPPPQVFYMHIVEDVVITDVGNIISGNLYLIPPTCTHHILSINVGHPKMDPPTPYEKLPLYDEVFIISQFWGIKNFYHIMLENLPRAAPYLEFLHANPNIHIHVQSKKEITASALEILKIDRSRLITGPARALRVFLPQGTTCGGPHVQSTQLLSSHFNHYIQNKPTNDVRDYILLIRRSRWRALRQNKELMNELIQIALENDLGFEMFIDNPSPSLTEAAAMFRRAILVVAPHGAGLANLIFCRPGTLVLEALCDPPAGALCFQFTAHVLGHRYHGISSQRTCKRWIEIDHKILAEAARKLLKEKFRPQE